MSLLGSVSASKASGADFFSSDLTCSAGRELLKVLIRVPTTTVVKMTLDSTNYYPINSNVALAADQWHSFEFPVSSSDTINFKQDTATMTLDCRVVQV